MKTNLLSDRQKGDEVIDRNISMNSYYPFSGEY